jgi:hypothetical protein
VQDNALLIDYHGMPCIMASLVASYDIYMLTQQVDNLSFTLIAPLGSQHHNISHVFSLFSYK